MSAPTIARPAGANPAGESSASDCLASAYPREPERAAAHPTLLRRPRRRSWWVDAVGLGTWASLLFVVVLWERGGGLQDLFSGTGSALSSAGRLTGLISSDLLLLQVLAMARIPIVERAVGQDRLAKWHRLAGFTSFNLMAAHIVLITLGYAAITGAGPLAELWSLITTAPGMLLAAAGTAALVAVVVTSVRAARRRLRYESWHLLHLYAYLGAGLALPHQLWTGGDFLNSPAATVFWWGLWGAAAASILVFRIAAPLWFSARHRLVVSHVHAEAPGVVAVHLTGRRLERMRASAGQFFVWRFRTGRGWSRAHPLSLSGAPTEAGLRLTIGTTGDDGARLAALTPGTRVMVEGPYGRLTADQRVRPRFAVIAAGVGLAPLLALVEESATVGTDDAAPILLHRARSPEDALHRHDLRRLVDTAGLQVIDLVGPRSHTGTAWLPTQYGHVPGPVALKQMVPDLDHRDVFVCGPALWADAVVQDLRAAGAAPEAIHLEHFTW